MCRSRRYDKRSDDPYKRARAIVAEKKGFYRHFTAFVLVNLFLLVSNLFSGDIFDSIQMTFFWGIGLAFHYVKVFGPVGNFGKDWEEREIEREMRKISRKDIDERLNVQREPKGYDKSDLV